MAIWCFRAVPGALPWSVPHRDYTTAIVVVAPTEARARELAMTRAGDEGFDCWRVPGFVGVEELDKLPPETEMIVLDDSCG